MNDTEKIIRLGKALPKGAKKKNFRTDRNNTTNGCEIF